MKKIVFLIVLVITAGCVSQKKYDDLNSRWNQVVAENRRLLTIESKYLETQQNLSSKENELQDTENELSTLEDRFKRLGQQYDDVLKRYDELISQNNQLILTTSREKSELTDQIGQLEKELNNKQREVWELELNLQSRNDRVEVLEKGIDDRNAKLIAISAEYSRQVERIDTLNYRLELILEKYLDHITFAKLDQTLTIALDHQFLFPYSPSIIDSNGIDAVTLLSQVLTSVPEIRIEVDDSNPSQLNGSETLTGIQRCQALIGGLVENGVDASLISMSVHLFVPNSGATEQQKPSMILRLSPAMDPVWNLIKS